MRARYQRAGVLPGLSAVVLADADTDARTADIPVGAKDRAGAKMDQARAVAPEVDLLSGAEPWFDKLTKNDLTGGHQN